MEFKGRKQNIEQEITDKNAEIQNLRQSISNPKLADQMGANKEKLTQAQAELAELETRSKEQKQNSLGGRIKGIFGRDK